MSENWDGDRTSSLSRTTTLATIATVGGYGTTLLQQLVYARALGVGADTDALAAALVWAVSVTGLVGSAFASAVIPPYVRAIRASAADATRLFRSAHAVSLGFGLLMSVGTWVLAAPLAAILLPGADPGSRAQLEGLLRITAPLHTLWMIVLAVVSLANARERYVVAAASTVIPSIPVIAALVLPDPGVERTAIAYSIGAIVQLAVIGFAIRGWWQDLLPRPALAFLAPIRGRIVPIVIAFVLMNLTALVTRSIASLGDAGDVALLDYATRLTIAGEAVLMSGVLAVSLTVWSADALAGSPERLPVTRVVRLAIGLAVISAAALAVLGTDLVSLLFGGGRFSEADVRDVGQLLAVLAPGMAARMLIMLAARAILARATPWQLVWPSLVSFVLMLVGGPIAHAAFGVVGVAATYSVAWGVSAAIAIRIVEPATTELVVLGREVGAALVVGGVAISVTALALATTGLDPAMRLPAGTITFGAVVLLAGKRIGIGFVDEFWRRLVRPGEA